MSGLPLGVDLFFGDVLSRKNKVRPFQNYVDILILVFFFFCISVKYKWWMLLCLCVYVLVYLCVLERERIVPRTAL